MTEPQGTGKEAAPDGLFQARQALHHVLMGGWSQQGPGILCVPLLLLLLFLAVELGTWASGRAL